MAKMRVHELAKQLEITNKEMLQVLAGQNIEVKSHMSTLTEEQVSQVMASRNKREIPKETGRENGKERRDTNHMRETNGNGQPARPEGQGQPVRKKKYISVYKPQNSRSNLKPPLGVRNSANRSSTAVRPQEAEGRRPVRPEAPRPEGQPVRTAPAGAAQGQGGAAQAAQNPAAQAPVRREPVSAGRPVPERPSDRGAGRGDRPFDRGGIRGDRPDRGPGRNDRPGDRGFQRSDRPGDRNFGGRGGDRGPAGARSDRPGDRGFQRSDRPGDRNFGGRGGDRPGDRGFQRSDRPGDRSFGGRGGDRRGGMGGRGMAEDRAALDRAALDHANAERANSEKRAYKEQAKKERQNRERKEAERDTLKQIKNAKPKKGSFIQPKPEEKKEDEIRTIVLPETLTIKELADAMKIQPAAIVKKLFLQGVVATVNQEIPYEKAEEIALEYNCIAEPEQKVDVIEELLKEEEEDESLMVSRPPVVCVMGHVDHGKTSLLDAIRNTNVISGEAGGITQHIGASVIRYNGQKITFLDTPGHEAFTAMRMRGANSTDIAILVVAADDGVMPQTVEAISHAKAAGIEIIVAINKIDKPSANIERVKQELTEYELIPEDWGGSTIFVPVSAKTHEGIDTLLEMVLLTAEMHELKANPKRAARGLVIEAELDKGKGPVATVLVQKGTLRIGDPIAAGACFGKVRAMMDDKGRRVKEAGPSMPVEILGLSDVPNAGEIFVSVKTEKEARSFAETFISEGREKLLEETKSRMSLDDLFSQIQAGNVKELNIIVKADVQGSVEAIRQSLLKLSNEEVVVKIIHGGVGAINESDVTLASASNAIIIGFNVRPDATAKAVAERENVDIRLYRVIYNAIEDVEAAMKGMLDPVYQEKVIGHAEVRQLFKASGVGTIAGSYVLDGVFQRNCLIRITREGTQIYEGSLASLKRFKDDVKEVKAGYECGLVFEKFNDLQELDQVEAYIMEEVPR